MMEQIGFDSSVFDGVERDPDLLVLVESVSRWVFSSKISLGGSPQIERETSHTHTEMETRKLIVCGLSASRIRPPLPQEDTDDDVEDITPTEVEVVEISDEEEDMVELSREEYMRNMDYLIRVEESEDDIELDFRRMLKRMHEE
ncbi:hypothetical protein Bca101_058582 [Brassica carinata]